LKNKLPFLLIFFISLLISTPSLSFGKQPAESLSYRTAKEEDYCKVPTKKAEDKKTEAASPDACIECIAKAKKTPFKSESEKILAKTQEREQKITEILAIEEEHLSRKIENNEILYLEHALSLLSEIKTNTLNEKKKSLFHIQNIYQIICDQPDKSLFSDANCDFIKGKMILIQEIQFDPYNLTEVQYNELQPHFDESKKYLSEYFKKKLQSIDKKIFDINKLAETNLKKLPDQDLDSIYTKALQKITKSAASEGQIPCNLTRVEYYLIRKYTASFYRQLNTELREKRAKLANVEKVLNTALDKFLDVKSAVIRGAELPQEELNQHQVGKIITYASFTSTSKGSGFISKTKFVIKSAHGKYIAPISFHGDEEEVLFKSKTKFKIISKNENEIVMEEVD